MATSLAQAPLLPIIAAIGGFHHGAVCHRSDHDLAMSRHVRDVACAHLDPLLAIIHISTVRMRPIFGAFVEVGLELTVPTVPDPVVAIFALVRLVGLDFEDPLADVDCVVAEVLVGCASA